MSQTKAVNLLLIVLFTLAWASMKISLPALPILGQALHTSKAYIKLSVSLFFICFGLFQLLWGLLGDHYSRRHTLIAGLSLAAIGTIIVIFSFNAASYIVGRCIEGIGMGSISPLGRAVLTDTLDTKAFTKSLSKISMIVGTMPAIAPLVGGYILLLFGWRSIFIVFLILLMGALVWLLKKLPETGQPTLTEFQLRRAARRYFDILKQRTYIKSVTCYVLLSGTTLGYYASMPFWFVDQWHMKEYEYAYLALFGVTSYLIGIAITRKLIDKISLKQILLIALSLALATSILALLLSALQLASIPLIIVVMSLFTAAAGIANPAANTLVLQNFKHCAATVSALTATLMFSATGVFSWIESHQNVTSLWQIGATLLAVTLVCGLVRIKL